MLFAVEQVTVNVNIYCFDNLLSLLCHLKSTHAFSMLTLLSEARFWTLKDEIIIKNTDFGSFRYAVRLGTIMK